MPVSEHLFSPLTIVYQGYALCSSTADLEAFLKTNRKKIKIIVDTLYEQIVENIVGVKPRNALDARQMINQNIDTVSDPADRNVLVTMNQVLQDYDALASKLYIDIVELVSPVLIYSLKNLCISLGHHPKHSGHQYANELLNVIEAFNAK